MQQKRRAFVIGIDGGAPDLIAAWVEQGKLPAFARLMREGIFGPLASVPNQRSAAAWTSFMTGRNPGKHGIYEFYEYASDHQKVRFLKGGDRQGATLWGLLSAAGRKVGVINKDITTSSLQAYEYFLKGKEAYAGMLWGDLKKEMEKVLEIDPSFAMSYVYLAYADYFLGDLKARNETLEKAMALSGRTSEKGRLYLEAAYAYFVKADNKRHELLLKELIRKYPKVKFAYHYRCRCVLS